MTAEGTVNRAALPAIFNPEDLNALEQALRLKEQNPGSTVGILTMGPHVQQRLSVRDFTAELTPDGCLPTDYLQVPTPSLLHMLLPLP